MRPQWDSIGKRYVEAGTIRWLIEWDTWTSDAPDRDPLADATTSVLEFPSKSEAIACAREIQDTKEIERRMVWEPRIRQEIFEADANGPGVGWWEPFGDYECLSDIEQEPSR